MPGGLYPPPSVIESWPKANFIDPPTQGPALLYLCAVFSSLSLASVAARIYSRTFITKAPGADDLFIVIAAGFGIALSVLIVIQQKTWLTGHHIWDIPIDKFSGQRKNVYICEWCYLTATCAVKISILLFYRRLSVTFSRTFLVATWVGIVYNALYWVTFVICLLALFRPLDSYWLSFDPTWAATHEYSHGHERWSLSLSAAFSVVGDFYSTVLPLMLIRFLDLPQRQKAALYALFGLGFLVVAAGIVRTLLLVRIVSQTYDVSWVLWENWVWTVIELNLAIVAASAPALKPFFRRLLTGPITGPNRQIPYAYDSRRRPSAGQAEGPRRFHWSNRTTAHESNTPVDMEKIGIALTAPQSRAEMIEEEIDDGVSTRRYQLRTSRDGKMVPVQIHEQRSFDARSLHTATSSDAIISLGEAEEFDASTERKEYQQREGVPPLPTQPQHQQYQRPNLSQSRPQSRHQAQTSGLQNVPESLNRIFSQSSNKTKLTSGSVAVARARAKAQQLHLEEFVPQESAYAHAHAQTGSTSRGSERNFSLPSMTVVGGSPYQQTFAERDEDDRSSSEDTLVLPRTGSMDTSGPGGVGYAV